MNLFNGLIWTNYNCCVNFKVMIINRSWVWRLRDVCCQFLISFDLLTVTASYNMQFYWQSRLSFLSISVPNNSQVHPQIRESSLRDWMKTMKKKVRSMWNRCYQNYQIVISGMAMMTMSQTCLLVWDCHDLWKLPTTDMTWELRRQWLTARMKTRTLQFVR